MRGKSLIFIVIAALLLAVVASGMITAYVKKHVSAATAAPLLVPVVVSSSDLSFGETLEESNLKVAMYPAESVPKGAVSQLDSLIGQSTKVFLAQDEPDSLMADFTFCDFSGFMESKTSSLSFYRLVLVPWDSRSCDWIDTGWSPFYGRSVYLYTSYWSFYYDCMDFS